MLMLEKHEFASERYFEKDIQIPIYFTEIPDVFPWFFFVATRLAGLSLSTCRLGGRNFEVRSSGVDSSPWICRCFLKKMVEIP